MKTAVITGAASGIGQALTKKFLKERYTVWALDIDGEALARLETESRKIGADLVVRKVDVCSDENLRAVQNELAQSHAPLSVWINNAGVSGIGEFEQLSQAEFDKTMNINFRATIVGTRVALELMKKQGKGTIINVASVAGYIPLGYLSAYCASKGAVVAFTKALREELLIKHSSVRLVLASPGFVDTPMVAKRTAHGLPEWLEWALVSPQVVAKEIFQGMNSGKFEIFPTWNGKVILAVSRLMPKFRPNSTRILLSKTFKDLLLNRLTPPN